MKRTALTAKTISCCLMITHAALIVRRIIHVLAIDVKRVYKTHAYDVQLIWRSVMNVMKVCTCTITNAYQHVHMDITLMINSNSAYLVMTPANTALRRRASSVNAITTNTKAFAYRHVQMVSTKTATIRNVNALRVMTHVKRVTQVQMPGALNAMTDTSTRTECALHQWLVNMAHTSMARHVVHVISRTVQCAHRTVVAMCVIEDSH